MKYTNTIIIIILKSRMDTYCMCVCIPYEDLTVKGIQIYNTFIIYRRSPRSQYQVTINNKGNHNCHLYFHISLSWTRIQSHPSSSTFNFHVLSIHQAWTFITTIHCHCHYFLITNSQQNSFLLLNNPLQCVLSGLFTFRSCQSLSPITPPLW